ncbi:FMN-binding negative transcriptional regulator [Variovorax saccharolyticus]|uniref:FMN-binding negative transcriptional regulator n=1 Tax=Variovorax saccharolyticus TaxID=3053516 RepID=UPI0025789BF6|nr:MULTISPECIES: FMN-binding negative transcriptional regulator [unclassified Variovorax]MDM0017076.1 FMN-binding negative transcriptional regulator [Variovorax sp. J22R187]MDM0023622.1 FMN-binding negative transcriptional regulator [Variovorax sp. J31P216]
MYMPPQFNVTDRAIAARLMRDHPFATLISNDDAGQPYLTHLPLVLDERGADDFALLGHCAKPNPHWRFLQARPQAVVSFLGPHAYLSPSVYPDLARVPTWNYLAVHCTVEARLIEGPDEKDALLKRLIGQHEPAYAQQWRDLGQEFQHKMLNGIVGFELKITALQCKVKLNQHRKESHAATFEMYREGTPDERALADWMQRLGITGEA